MRRIAMVGGWAAGLVAFGIGSACIIVIPSFHDVAASADWVGLVRVDCGNRPLDPATIDAMRREADDLDSDLDENDDPDSYWNQLTQPVLRNASVLEVVWRTPAGTPPVESFLPYCNGEEGEREVLATFRFSEGTWASAVHRLTERLPAKSDRRAASAWLRRGVEIAKAAVASGADVDASVHDWLLEGVVDPRTRELALWDRSGAFEETLRPEERERIASSFLAYPDAPGTLGGMLAILRDFPSLPLDVAAVDAMERQLNDVESGDSSKLPSNTRWDLCAVLERLGYEDAYLQIREALARAENVEVPAAREIWDSVRCEKGYLPARDCPESLSAEARPPEP